MTTSVAYARSKYTNTRVMSTSEPLELIIMLYDGAIGFLEMAAGAAESNNVPTKIKYIEKALAVIDELLNSLNPNVGGQLIDNLANLYLYMMREIASANARNDADKMRHVVGLLRDLREGWVALRGNV